MAMTLPELQEMVTREGIKFYVDPNRPVLMFIVNGANGKFQFVIKLDCDGEFFQMRTIGYLYCPDEHPSLFEVLKVLSFVNFRRRFCKTSWDQADGEIMLYADVCLINGKLTQEQLNVMINLFLSLTDELFPRLQTTIQTGKDPGEQTRPETNTGGGADVDPDDGPREI